MNRPVDPAVAISPADLQWARTESARGERKFIELLEERLACGPTEFVARLALTLRLPAVALDDMRAETAAFELVPYAEASRRSCLALRAPEGRMRALALHGAASGWIAAVLVVLYVLAGGGTF